MILYELHFTPAGGISSEIKEPKLHNTSKDKLRETKDISLTSPELFFIKQSFINLSCNSNFYECIIMDTKTQIIHSREEHNRNLEIHYKNKHID